MSDQELTKQQKDDLMLKDLLRKLGQAPHGVSSSRTLSKGKVRLNAGSHNGGRQLNWLSPIDGNRIDGPYRPVTSIEQRAELTRIRMYESELGWFDRRHVNPRKPYPTNFEPRSKYV